MTDAGTKGAGGGRGAGGRMPPLRKHVMAEDGRRVKKLRRLSRSRAGNITIIIILGIFALFMSLPLVYSISMAFKPIDELFLYPPRFFPMKPTLRNFTDLMISFNTSVVPFSRYMFNSVLVTGAATAGHVIIAAMCAYPLAKHKFRYRNAIFSAVVLSLLFSTWVLGIPRFVVMSKTGLLNHYGSLILPAMASSLGLYLLKQFMEQVPDSILESARIDGAGEFRILWGIVMPTVKPAWLTLILLSVRDNWNDEYSPTLYIFNEAFKPVTMVKRYIFAAGFVRVGAYSAFSLIMLLPPILIFILSQSNVIETMKSSGMKE